MKNLTLFILISAFLLISCEDIINHDDKPNSDNHILFQYEVINYAWGFTHYGFFITNDGKIHGFDKPENWTFTDTLETIDKSILERNLSQSSEILGQLSKDKIKSLKSNISEAANGEIIDDGWVMADAGLVIYRSFVYDKNSGDYNIILIKQLGDYQKINQSEEAEKIYIEMKEIAIDHYSWSF